MTKRELATSLATALEQNQIALDSSVQQKLIHYLELLTTWNRVFNLTAITDTREMVYLHLIDSLIISPYLKGPRLLDVGTGAGLPGIPLAIMNPAQKWTLLDKNSKKTRFLIQAISELELSNVKVEHSRSEDFKTTHCFDSILSRAYGTLAMFIDTTAHLLCENGQLIAMKGQYPQDELKEIPDTFVAKVQRLDLQGMNIERHICVLTQK